MSSSKTARHPSVTDLLHDKLSARSDEVREIAMWAIKASETLPEQAVAEQIMARIREYTRASGGDD
jgi:hypothetical protein